MPVFAPITLNAPQPSMRDSLGIVAPSAPAALQVPSPIGQPQFGVRLGLAQSDSLCYFGGINYEIPISLGIHIVSLRVDGDVWQHVSSGSGGSSAGGVAVAADAIFGPGSSYVGAGLAYAARYGGASGPTGPALKLLTGSQFIASLGYEISVIVASKGAVGAVMATWHF
ncbi:MAG TPA: hypothetical protein VG944_11810 [Fimbriimonas sp.]|nr:hypothetical protein [Fimbriimonas sp.]